MRAFAPLRDRVFARLWSGLAVFTLGDELYRVALVWLAVELVGRQAGYLGAVSSGCMLAGAIFGGAIASAIDPRRAMSILLAMGAATALVPALAWDLGMPSLWALAIPAVGISLMRAQLEPAVQGHLPSLVADRGRLFAANSLIDGVRRMARLSGPTLAAALALLMPVHALFYVYALALLVASYLLLRVGANLPTREKSSGSGFAQGWQIVRAQPVLRNLLALKFCTDGCWGLVIGYGLPLIVEQRDATWAGLAGIAAYGAGLATYALANIAASLVVGSLKPTLGLNRMQAGLTLMGVGLAATGAVGLLASDAWLLPALYLALAVAGFGPPFFEVPFTLRVQLAGSAHSVGAASSVHRVRMVAVFGGIMTAGLVSPSLFGQFGTAASMVGAGVAATLATLFVWWRLPPDRLAAEKLAVE
jgi:MFS transporter, DHA3 family, macrolide efflux protein